MKETSGRSKAWSTFLRIPPESTSDLAPALDPGWCAARGVNTGAATVLRLLRDEVLPLVRRFEERADLKSYHFLIHDRTSGVPAPEGDHGSFIHLRLFFDEPWTSLDFGGRFEMTRPTPEDNESVPGGIDKSILKDNTLVRKLINAQSKWVLDLVEAHKWTDDALMVRQVQQFGHFFCNVLQMRLA